MDVSRRELNRRYLISNYPDKIYRKTKETTIRVLFLQMLPVDQGLCGAK